MPKPITRVYMKHFELTNLDISRIDTIPGQYPNDELYVYILTDADMAELGLPE